MKKGYAKGGTPEKALPPRAIWTIGTLPAARQRVGEGVLVLAPGSYVAEQFVLLDARTGNIRL